MRNKETVDSIFINGLQNFDKCDTLNHIEIKIEEDKILRNLQEYHSGNIIYRFTIDDFIFSSGITSEASTLFISFHGLTNASGAVINRKNL